MTFAAPFSRVFRPPFGPGLAAVATGPVTLIYDTFTDADTTALASHTIAPTNTPATSWTERVGTWTIESNTARIAASANSSHVTCNAGVADCTITLTLTTIGNQAADNVLRRHGIVARWSDTSNYWVIGVLYYPGGSAYGLEIIERNAGTSTVRASAACTPANGMTVTAVLSGTTITASESGGATCNYTSAVLSATKTVHGMHVYRVESRFDNFTVTTP